MQAVRAVGLAKTFGSVAAVTNLTFEAKAGEFLTLLGPSGCGKTTTLRLIAGLEKPDAGDIYLGTRPLSSADARVFVPPERRSMGMVFQSYAIWPHMTVFENVAFPLQELRLPRAEIRDRAMAIIETVGLAGLDRRPAPLLSGGQQQRVALARALVSNPEVLLLDEPLSNLDARLREEMRFELRDMQARLGITSIFVTHDQAEAMTLSDHIIVMNAGHMEDPVDHGVALDGAGRPRAGPGRGALVDHRAHGLPVPQPARVPPDPLVLLPAARQGARVVAAVEPSEGVSQPAPAPAPVLRRRQRTAGHLLVRRADLRERHRLGDAADHLPDPRFRNMDAALEESARMCGASPTRTVIRILVPLLRPAILAAFILSLTRLLSSFETEVFLGTSAGIYVLTNKIYERMVQIFPPDFRTGMTMAVLLLVITFGLVLVNWRVLGTREYTTVTGRGYSVRPMPLGKLRWVAFGFVMLFFVITVVLPAAVLVQVSFIRFLGLNVFDLDSYTLDNWRRMLTLRLNRSALTNSLVMSIVATTVGMVLYSLVSYVVTRSRYKGRRLLDLAAWVPWAVPSLILGLGLLWAVLLSPLAVLYGTLTLLILAHIIRGFPFGTQIMGTSMIQISRELEKAARIHHATWTSTFRRIWLPLVKNGFVAGWVIQFTVSFSDLGTVAFLYGAKSTVLPTLFLSQWSNGRLEEASVAALMMTVVVLAVVVLVRRLVQGSVRTSTAV